MKYLKEFADYCIAACMKKVNVPVWVFVALVVLYMLPRPF